MKIIFNFQFSIFNKFSKLNSGFLVVQILVFATISAVMLGALALWGATSFTASRKAVLREQAYHIAEAGIEYYRWHLAHNTTDYQDGTGVAGPYLHNYYDKDGVLIGTFTLTITPPPNGGTTVVIRSKGTVTEDVAISRTLEETLSIASYARYALLSGNAILYVGTGADVTGQALGNNGVRFNGLAHNIIYSAVDKFNDTSYSPTRTNQLGVHTDVSPADGTAPVSAIPPHSDVFLAGREFPSFYNVIPVDFGALTAVLSDLRDESQMSTGFHLDKSSGSSLGYHIVLKTNDTFDLYKVTKKKTKTECYSYADPNTTGHQLGWNMGSIDVGGEEFLSNNPYPANGIIFVEDDLWLDGQINGNRLTVVVGSFYDNGNGDPQAKNITINNDIQYTNYDGTDALGIIAQNDISVGWASDDNLRIDGALIAKGGRIGRFKFASPGCSPYNSRAEIYLYGMLATYNSGGFAYGSTNGYQIRTYVYDSNLYYNPPPSFPRTSSQYSILKWKEIQK